MELPSTRRKAIINFEIKLSQYLKNMGFMDDSYMRVFKNRFELQYARCAYLYDAYDLLNLIGFPIVKFRLFSPVYFEEAEKVYHYVKDNCAYDENLISSHICRLKKMNAIRPYSENELEKFCSRYKKIYVFGTGIFGRAMERYFEKRGWEIAAFVTTQGDKENHVLSLEQLKIEDTDGIVIALGEAALQEVICNIRKRYPKDQLLIPK